MNNLNPSRHIKRLTVVVIWMRDSINLRAFKRTKATHVFACRLLFLTNLFSLTVVFNLLLIGSIKTSKSLVFFYLRLRGDTEARSFTGSEIWRLVVDSDRVVSVSWDGRLWFNTCLKEILSVLEALLRRWSIIIIIED